jgi:hypothetical protein
LNWKEQNLLKKKAHSWIRTLDEVKIVAAATAPKDSLSAFIVVVIRIRAKSKVDWMRVRVWIRWQKATEIMWPLWPGLLITFKDPATMTLDRIRDKALLIWIWIFIVGKLKFWLIRWFLAANTQYSVGVPVNTDTGLPANFSMPIYQLMVVDLPVN